MRKAMGSLLLVVYLAGTPKLYSGTYKITKENKFIGNKSVVLFYDRNKEKIKESLEDYLNSLMKKFDYNMFKLKSLLTLQKSIFNRVHAAINLKAKSKEVLSTNQIECFRSYIRTYSDDKVDVDMNVDKLRKCDNLTKVQNELLSVKTDYRKVYENINELNKTQEKTIMILDNMVKQGNMVLSVLA